MLALLLHTNSGFRVVVPMMAQQILADSYRAIFLNITVILIMQELYNLFFNKNSFILFYKDSFSTCIYLVISSDFDNLK